MKNLRAGLGLASLALVLSAPVSAGTSADFSGCDGLRKPKRSDDGMRGEAEMPPWRLGDMSNPGRTIASCNRALESGKLRPEQTLRHAHVLRARGAAKLELGDFEGSLADFDAADAAAREYEGDFFYERSMGVSIDLLRAIALNDAGKRGETLALAEAAMARRPYALAVQRVGTMLRAGSHDQPGDPEIWKRLAQIDPATRSLSARLASSPTEFAELADSAGEPEVTMPAAASLGNVLGGSSNLTSLLNDWTAPVSRAMRTAYALAAAGDKEAALSWVDATRAAITPDPDGGEDKKFAPLAGMLIETAKASVFDPMEMLVDARIAVSEGRFADVANAIDGKALRSTLITDELYAAYAAAEAGEGVEKPRLPALGAKIERKPPKLASLAGDLLMSPESERELTDYKASRPDILAALVGGAFSLGTSLLGGIPRTAGFKETENEDGSIKVEYTGNTTSGAVVQEMTLLRAAEVAQAAGKSHFHIAERNDYQRYLTMTQYGIERSRTLTGYKTEITLNLLDDASGQPEAIDAVSIIDALGPIYYEDDQQS